jgi:hypothetical protein
VGGVAPPLDLAEGVDEVEVVELGEVPPGRSPQRLERVVGERRVSNRQIGLHRVDRALDGLPGEGAVLGGAKSSSLRRCTHGYGIRFAVVC